MNSSMIFRHALIVRCNRYVPKPVLNEASRWRAFSASVLSRGLAVNISRTVRTLGLLERLSNQLEQCRSSVRRFARPDPRIIHCHCGRDYLVQTVAVLAG